MWGVIVTHQVRMELWPSIFCMRNKGLWLGITCVNGNEIVIGYYEMRLGWGIKANYYVCDTGGLGLWLWLRLIRLWNGIVICVKWWIVIGYYVWMWNGIVRNWVLCVRMETGLSLGIMDMYGSSYFDPGIGIRMDESIYRYLECKILDFDFRVNCNPLVTHFSKK